jgi:putative transposase
MPYDPERHHRRSIRLVEHDYAAGGTNFITICTNDRELIFGEVRDGIMFANALGRATEQMWVESEIHRPGVVIDVFALMPNHLHGLVRITPVDIAEHVTRLRPSSSPTSIQPGRQARRPKSLSTLITQFKATSTVVANDIRETPGAKVWQRGFHECVVRNDDEFERIAEYIVTNPARWAEDANNPSSEKETGSARSIAAPLLWKGRTAVRPHKMVASIHPVWR